MSNGRVWSTEVSLAGFIRKVERVQAAALNSDSLEQIAEAGATVFEVEAKALVPVLDGDLRQSIHLETIERSSRRARVAVIADAPHAKRTEFGHARPGPAHPWPIHQAPEPYMRPAYDTKKEDARAAMLDAAAGLLAPALKNS